MRHIYILSGTTLQANHFIYRNELPPEDYVRITTPEMFRGSPHGARVVKVGTWEHHPYLPELENMFVNRSANLITEKEWLGIANRGLD